jgi:hypothetical protein
MTRSGPGARPRPLAHGLMEPQGPSPAVPGRRQPYRLALTERAVVPREANAWRFLAVVLALGAIAYYTVIWTVTSKSVGVAIVEIPFLMLLTAPLFVLAARTETRFDLAGLLATGLGLRFIACYYRFTHAADAATYHNSGIELARSFRNLNFGVDPGSPVPGTGGMKIVAGVAEVFTNSNAFGTFLLFSWLGFIGCYLLYRAFVTAMPDGDHHRYAFLIFLWPTLVFWPSSIGKDCWMLLCIGVAALGAARVLTRMRGGYWLLVLGSLAGSFVRPHVSLLLLMAFAVALLVGRRRSRPGAITPGAVGKVAGLVVLLVLGAVLATRTADLLNANDISSVSVGSALSESSARTGQGGSAFVPADPQNPVGYVKAAATVLFRPFPFETSGVEGIVTSVEALFLAALAVASWRRLASIPHRLRSDPYVTLAIAYTLMFIFAFGTLSNFGILARERSQLVPFLFVLLSLTPFPAGRGPRPAAEAPDEHPTLPYLSYRARRR